MKSRVVRARDVAPILSSRIDLVRTSMCNPNLAPDETWRLTSIISLKKARVTGDIEHLLVARDEVKAWIVDRSRRNFDALSQPNTVVVRLSANASERDCLSAVIGLHPRFGAPRGDKNRAVGG
jgi:hypothetical protein